ncbi:MAG: DNA alkylation repair protein [Rhodobacteraceae bacterium]|nr:DNA alkylation repair protein [Paracoccaceae bacterium]
MTPHDAIEALRAHAQVGKAEEMARYHKVPRAYLGVANPDIDAAARTWRQQLTLDDRLSLAAGLWHSDIHEARVAAAKLLTQARIRPDDSAAWRLIVSWVPTFDAWAVADHASMAGQRRLSADPARLDEVETWTTSAHMWTRRAALVMTLPWTRQNHPKPTEEQARDRILGWAAGYVDDHEWFIQKAVAWWVRDLSKHDAPRARTFLDTYGPRLKPLARREAGKYLK